MRLVGWVTLATAVLVAIGTGLWTIASSLTRDGLCAGATVKVCETQAVGTPNSGFVVATLLLVFGLVMLAASRPRPRDPQHGNEAADSQDRPPDEDETTQKRSLSLALWYLPVAALFFFTLAYILGSHTTEPAAFFREVLFAIGTAFLISWGFSALLDIPHVSNSVVACVADLLLGEEFLRRKRTLLPDLRRRIDRVVYGEAQLVHPGSLYNAVNDQLEEIFKSSYRRNFTVEIVCSEEGTDKIRWMETTRYIYVRNPADQQPMVIGIESERALTQTESIAAVADPKGFFSSHVKLSFKIGGSVFVQDAKEPRLAEKGGKDVIDLVVTIEAQVLKYSFNYQVTRQGFTARGVDVEIVEEVTKERRDDIYYSFVALPTEDFTLVGHFPKDVRLEAIRFAPGSSGGVETSARGRAMVTINGWLMPGHGACLGWFGFDVLDSGVGAAPAAPPVAQEPGKGAEAMKPPEVAGAMKPPDGARGVRPPEEPGAPKVA